MIRHLFKLVWHRKRTNGLLIFEIFCSFLVLFAVATLGIFLMDNYRRPLGFAWNAVWNVRVATGASEDAPSDAEQVELFARVLREVRGLDEVESAAGCSGAPYDSSTWLNSFRVDGGREVTVEVISATDDLPQVLGLNLVRGRWFEAADSSHPWRAVVIDGDLSAELFGAEDPVGKKLPDGDEGEGARVVGVIAEFRKGGELSAPGFFMAERAPLDAALQNPPRNLLLKIRPGTRPEFEQQLVARMQAVAPQWTFEVDPLSKLREKSLRMRLAPLIAGAVIAGFLMTMVALGLLGVLWQNVTQRTREFGLRRAVGASGGDVRRQVQIELFLMTTLGCVLGAIVVVQIPIMNFLTIISDRVFAIGLVASAVAIYSLSAVCGLYPSWLATRVQPVEALHYD